MEQAGLIHRTVKSKGAWNQSTFVLLSESWLGFVTDGKIHADSGDNEWRWRIQLDNWSGGAQGILFPQYKVGSVALQPPILYWGTGGLGLCDRNRSNRKATYSACSQVRLCLTACHVSCQKHMEVIMTKKRARIYRLFEANLSRLSFPQYSMRVGKMSVNIIVHAESIACHSSALVQIKGDFLVDHFGL